MKAWVDQKDGLAVKVVVGDGAQSMTMVDVRRVTFAAPSATKFVLPAGCAGAKAPPTPAETMTALTGDDAANWAANLGPSSKNSCTIVFRVVSAGTMAPIAKKYQVAIDPTYSIENPPHYTFGIGDDGTSTFSGGGLHEVTSQVRNGMLRIENAPAVFGFAVNVPTPHYGPNSTFIYRQCYAPVTVLYEIVNDVNDPSKGDTFLYAKSGKYATVAAH